MKKERSRRKKKRSSPYKLSGKSKKDGSISMPYSIDISYYFDNPASQSEYDTFFEEFESQINWYAADSGPFNANERKYRSNAYFVKDSATLLALVKKTKADDKFFVDFVTKKNASFWRRHTKVPLDDDSTEIEKEVYAILDQ